MNDKFSIPFSVDKRKNWSEHVEGEITLSFLHNWTDGVGDYRGYLFLRIPRTQLEPGKPLTLQVTGGRNNSPAWYMTFKKGLKPGLQVNTYPAIVKGKERKSPVAVNVYHFDHPVKAKLYSGKKMIDKIELRFGHNIFQYEWPEVKEKKTIEFEVRSKNFKDKIVAELHPARKWQVNFIQHSHTDIGYTRPQTEILAEHLRYIDYALDYCDATDDHPNDAKFRWTCEAAWAVDEYLKCRPKEQIERLRKRTQEGRIEITGMYFNFDELPDEQTLAASLAPIKRFKEHGLKVQLAMQNDVNGTGWCFNDYFSPLGIKYLDMGTHGHKALICFDIPTAFWWESPSGNRMLAFRAEHYMTGNTLGIHTQNFEYFEEKMMNYLVSLDEKGYPHDLIAIQHSGFLTDNSPPSTLSSEMIKQWNEKYEWPKLRSSIASEFFEQTEREHGAELPVFKVAWPDWWTDGFGSAAREVAATRDAHSHIIANQGILSMAKLLGSEMPEGIDMRITETNKSILFYGEHTMGSSESVRRPYSTATMEQREMKESFAWEANRRARMIGEEAMGLIQQYYSKTELPSMVVFNTLNWERDGLVEIYIDHQILPTGKKFKIVDEDGKEAPAQDLGHRSDGTYWGIWVENIPPFGSKKYYIQVSKKDDFPMISALPDDQSYLENKWYRIKPDMENASITSIYDKEINKELIDQGARWKLGAFINEILDNRSQLESFRLNNYKRIGLDSIWYDGYEVGPVWNTLRFKGETKTFFSPNGFEVEFRMYNTSKRIDLAYRIVKKPIISPEGIYLSFPFKLDGARIFSEVPGGVMEAGVDQLPGSSNDWNTIQYFTSVRNSEAQIVLGSQEVPLVQYGGINTGRFMTGASPGSNHIFSWPMNNYWTTNFNADQRGGHEWSYYLTSSDDTSNQFATQFGWGARIPMHARVLPPGKPIKTEHNGSILSGFPENVLLVNSRPGDEINSVVLQLRELDGKICNLTIRDKNGKMVLLEKVNVLGLPFVQEKGKPDIGAFENAFFKVRF